MNLYTTEYPAIYRGKVEDIEDPKNLGRCRVRVPSIQGSESDTPVSMLPWARPISSSPISSGRGVVNLPDKGDIVWVMFESSNKRYPVYFGGTYASGEVDIDSRKVDLYIENGNKISYDRDNGSYTINVGENTITVNGDSVKLTVGSTSISISSEGSTLENDVTVNGDLSVNGNLYVNSIMTGGSLFADMDFSGMTQEEMEELLTSLGISDLTDPLGIASKFMGFNEADGTADIFTNDLGFGSSSVTPWCACFVSYCLKQAGISGIRSAGVSTLTTQAQNLGLYKSSSNYTPSPGDVFLMSGDHTGFVASVDTASGTFTTVEGNSSNRVQSVTRPISGGSVTGFIQLSSS